MEVIDKGIVVQDEHLNFTYGNSAALRLPDIEGDGSLDDAMRLENWMLVREDGTVMPEAEYPAVRAMRDGRIIESRSEEHTAELQSLMSISYADFCLNKKTN